MCRAYPQARHALEHLRGAGVRLACLSNKEERYSGCVPAHVIAVLGGARDCSAHVGDSRIDIEAARNAGVAAWAVSYGYNRTEPIAKAQPERLFRDLGEVAEHVLG